MKAYLSAVGKSADEAAAIIDLIKADDALKF
jgi:hypothetical protein